METKQSTQTAVAAGRAAAREGLQPPPEPQQGREIIDPPGQADAIPFGGDRSAQIQEVSEKLGTCGDDTDSGKAGERLESHVVKALESIMDIRMYTPEIQREALRRYVLNELPGEIATEQAWEKFLAGETEDPDEPTEADNEPQGVADEAGELIEQIADILERTDNDFKTGLLAALQKRQEQRSKTVDDNDDESCFDAVVQWLRSQSREAKLTAVLLNVLLSHEHVLPVMGKPCLDGTGRGINLNR